ncbi:MAG: glycoside hydrolase family 16 protein [Planctomycetota bacterium]|nr:glycoside hydrolase family 16 protein [Planctomycetota bacterium]
MKSNLITLWLGIGAVAIVFCTLAGATALGDEGKAGGAEPGIIITRSPPDSVKPGPDSWGTIEGTVSGVKPDDYRVVIYAYGDMWYVQPFVAAPYTEIGKDGKWKADTHGGYKYAALLVKSSYKPPSTTRVLPEVGGDVLAIAQASAGEENKKEKTLRFSGYVWRVKSSQMPVGPGPNYFSDSADNVWVDDEGRLHLKITHRNDQWQCAEIISKQSFGYGTYRFRVDSRADDLDPNVVLGLFTWSDDPAQSHREIDIEFARWGQAEDKTNAQFVVQPAQQPGRLIRYRIPPEVTPGIHSFTWSSDKVVFRSVKEQASGLESAGSLIQEWTFSQEGVPQAGGENVRMNLWLLGGRAPKNEQTHEVIIRRFEFVPLDSRSP